MSESTPADARVVAVVVSYNRSVLLGECLDGIAMQSRPVDALVVVDNASTDGAADLAGAHSSGPEVIRLTRNTGGAGGFAVGIAAAIERHGAELVWIMDDDTVPAPGALHELLEARTLSGDTPAVLASTAVWLDGVTEHPMNRPRRRLRTRSRPEDGAAGLTPIRSASFVSILFPADAVLASGLPIADFFLWNDDFEFTTRLLRRDHGYYSARSIVMHKTRVLGSTSADPGPRFYYEVRNKIWLFRFSPGLAPLERAVYIASTLRRWTATLVTSRNRPELLRGLRRGVRDGFRSGPRPNGESLADQGLNSALVDGRR